MILVRSDHYIQEEIKPEENELSKKLSPIEMLTDDIFGAIIFYCDLPTRNTLLRLCKKFNQITDLPNQWKNLADILNISFYKEIKENSN